MATHETPQHFTNGRLQGRIAYSPLWADSFVVFTTCGKEIPCRRINDALSLLKSPYKPAPVGDMPKAWQLRFMK